MKLKITENQLKMVKKKLTEGVAQRYKRNVKIDYYYHGTTLKGREINDIIPNSILLTYDIEMEAREWGIKDVSLFGITGPSEVELEVSYYEGEEEKETYMPLKLDWSIAETDTQTGQGIVSVGEEIEITLGNDEAGNLVVKSILIPVYSL